ncbi:MAG TPA: hypothetical protein VLH18_07375 [Candidatus Limnocylindrales bacterium]|nr:hypothetical protein [Candidatus Limnocylindrales bacterium]
MKICKNNMETVLKAIRQGSIDAAGGGFDRLMDQTILQMHHHGLL